MVNFCTNKKEREKKKTVEQLFNLSRDQYQKVLPIITPWHNMSFKNSYQWIISHCSDWRQVWNWHWSIALPAAGGWNLMIPGVPPNPSHSMILWQNSAWPKEKCGLTEQAHGQTRLRWQTAAYFFQSLSQSVFPKLCYSTCSASLAEMSWLFQEIFIFS